MGRPHDIYEEQRDSEATRCARPISGPAPSCDHARPSYDDEELAYERAPTPKTSYATSSPFVAPAEIEGERSPAIRARRASYVDRVEFSRHVPHACSQELVDTQDLVGSAPEIEEVTSFAPPSRRSRPASNPASNPADRPLDYDALKLFLFEDGPDPGAPDYMPAPPSRAELPPPRPPMTSAHPEFEGPRGSRASVPSVRQPMFSSHPDFEGPRGGVRPSARVPMHSAHPDFEGPRGSARQQMFSSHPDFEGPRGGSWGAPAHRSSRIEHEGPRSRRMPAPPPVPQLAAELVETHDRLPRTPVHAPPPPPAPPVPGARAPMPAIHPHTFSGGPSPFAGNTFAMAMPPSEESSPSHDGSVNGSWIVPTPPETARASRNNLEHGTFRVTLSFVAAAVTAIAALAVMLGAIFVVRADGMSRGAQARESAAATETEALPPAGVAPTHPAPVASAVMANANARADQTAPLPPSAMAPPPPADPSDAPKVGKKKTRKRAVVKAPIEEDETEEEAPPLPKTTTKKPASKGSDKNVEKLLADLQEEQLRR